MTVRPFRVDDAAALSRIFHSAIHQIAAHHYDADQVAAWAPEVPDPQRFIMRGTDGRILLVAVDNDDVPLAYGDCEADGHIDHLFCRPDYAGTGLAAALYAEIETAAKSRGITALHVEASESARRFFARQGFATEARNDFVLNGVAIHNFQMTKRLD
jgi:putative acetyltransferase